MHSALVVLTDCIDAIDINALNQDFILSELTTFEPLADELLQAHSIKATKEALIDRQVDFINLHEEDHVTFDEDRCMEYFENRIQEIIQCLLNSYQNYSFMPQLESIKTSDAFRMPYALDGTIPSILNKIHELSSFMRKHNEMLFAIAHDENEIDIYSYDSLVEAALARNKFKSHLKLLGSWSFHY